MWMGQPTSSSMVQIMQLPLLSGQLQASTVPVEVQETTQGDQERPIDALRRREQQRKSCRTVHRLPHGRHQHRKQDCHSQGPISQTRKKIGKKSRLLKQIHVVRGAWWCVVFLGRFLLVRCCFVFFWGERKVEEK